jgi:hypothetical protein
LSGKYIREEVGKVPELEEFVVVWW